MYLFMTFRFFPSTRSYEHASFRRPHTYCRHSQVGCYPDQQLPSTTNIQRNITIIIIIITIIIGSIGSIGGNSCNMARIICLLHLQNVPEIQHISLFFTHILASSCAGYSGWLVRRGWAKPNFPDGIGNATNILYRYSNWPPFSPRYKFKLQQRSVFNPPHLDLLGW